MLSKIKLEVQPKTKKFFLTNGYCHFYYFQSMD